MLHRRKVSGPDCRDRWGLWTMGTGGPSGGPSTPPPFPPPHIPPRDRLSAPSGGESEGFGAGMWTHLPVQRRFSIAHFPALWLSLQSFAGLQRQVAPHFRLGVR